jgi:hypothetical protein
MSAKELKGWDHIVYTMIVSNFRNGAFTLQELYEFEPYFMDVYPKNAHIKDKIRQVLQHLRDEGLVVFLQNGVYEMTPHVSSAISKAKSQKELVYLLSNASIPGWVKIGRTRSIEDRLKALYNTSVPLPFVVEETISTPTSEQSRTLEKSIHTIIDDVNPDLRRNTEASRREFFRMSPEEGKFIFALVSKIMAINPEQSMRTHV